MAARMLGAELHALASAEADSGPPHALPSLAELAIAPLRIALPWAPEIQEQAAIRALRIDLEALVELRAPAVALPTGQTSRSRREAARDLSFLVEGRDRVFPVAESVRNSQVAAETDPPSPTPAEIARNFLAAEEIDHHFPAGELAPAQAEREDLPSLEVAAIDPTFRTAQTIVRIFPTDPITARIDPTATDRSSAIVRINPIGPSSAGVITTTSILATTGMRTGLAGATGAEATGVAAEIGEIIGTATASTGITTTGTTELGTATGAVRGTCPSRMGRPPGGSAR